MDHYQAKLPPSTGGGGGNTLALFLGLYLLILAFFILLVSISTVETVKSKAVMDSLSAAFTSILPPSLSQRRLDDEKGDVIAGQAFQEQITGMFETDLQVAKVEVVKPGRLMRVLVPSDSLFFTGKTEIRPARYPLLDRMVAAVSGRPPGLRYDVEFVIGSDYVGDKSLPIGQTLELARAGAFARQLLARGVPPDSISIGISPGEPTESVIWFFVRARDEARLRFEAPEEVGSPSRGNAGGKRR